MLLGGNAKRKKFWEPIIQKIEKRLSLWKSKLISKVGRGQLIKSVLNNLPSYYLSLFKIPNCVGKRIISLGRRFFKGGDGENRKLATVGWKEMEAPIKFGGLGFGNIELRNLGLLMKWWFKYTNTGDCLWKRIVKSTFP